MEHRLRDLIAAVAGQDSDSVVEMLQEHHISNMDTQDKQGHTVLMVASRVGLAVEGIRALCEHGASVSATTQSGKTALMMAARVGNVQAIKVLSKFGADINEMDFGKCLFMSPPHAIIIL
jgi:ankyrin repeat protein